jgi:hypothetical protein
MQKAMQPCTWCGRPFKLREGGGKRQRFCCASTAATGHARTLLERPRIGQSKNTALEIVTPSRGPFSRKLRAYRSRLGSFYGVTPDRSTLPLTVFLPARA